MKTQERARANAPEFEEAWGNDDFDLGRGSRASSPGDDYIDVEGNVSLGLVPPNAIHRTMGADTSLSHTTTPTRKPAPAPGTSEVKRGRGRPRKQRDPVEEGMSRLVQPTNYQLIHHSLVRNWSCIVHHIIIKSFPLVLFTLYSGNASALSCSSHQIHSTVHYICIGMCLYVHYTHMVTV